MKFVTIRVMECCLDIMLVMAQLFPASSAISVTSTVISCDCCINVHAHAAVTWPARIPSVLWCSMVNNVMYI